MSLTFFWRCEGTTLDGTDDFTAGDTTAAANSTPSISATAAKIGSNGLLFDSVSDQYRFAPTSIISPATGAVAFWVQWPTSISASNNAPFFARGASSASDKVQIGIASTDEVNLTIDRNGGGGISITTAAANLTAGNWYFVVAAWDQPLDDAYIGVYNSSLSLLSQNESLSTAYSQPTALDSGDGLRFGDSQGSLGTCYMDNIFIGSAYSDKDVFVTNANITSYTSYSGGGGGSSYKKRRVALMGVG